MADRNRVTGSAAALRGNSWDPRPDPNSLGEQISRLAKGFSGLVRGIVGWDGTGSPAGGPLSRAAKRFGQGVQQHFSDPDQQGPIDALRRAGQGIQQGIANPLSQSVRGMGTGISQRVAGPLSDAAQGIQRGVQGVVGGIKGFEGPLSPGNVQGYSDSFSGMLQNMFGGGGSPMGIMGRIPFPAGGAGLPTVTPGRPDPVRTEGRLGIGAQPNGAPRSPVSVGPLTGNPSVAEGQMYQGQLQGDSPYSLVGGAPYLDPLANNPSYGSPTGRGVGPLMSQRNQPTLPNQLYPGQGPLMGAQAPSFAGAIPPGVLQENQRAVPGNALANQEAGLAGLISRMREAGQGFGPNAQAGLAADQAAYADAYGRAAMVGRNDVGLSEQERANFTQENGYGFADSAAQSAASGGAIGAGMRDRFVGRNPLGGTESVSMNPDRGLGFIERTEGRYGQNPLRINRQMSDQDSLLKWAQDKAARTGTKPEDHLKISRDGQLTANIKNTSPEESARIRRESAERGQKFRDEHGGLNRKEFRRQRRIEQAIISQFRREGASAETMAKLLAPQLAERLSRRRGGTGSPSSPVTGNAPAPPELGQATPSGIQQSQAYVATQEPTTALAQANGWTPDTSVADIRTSVDSMQEKGTQLKDEDLVDLHRAVKSRAALVAAEGGNAFDSFQSSFPNAMDAQWAPLDRKYWEEFSALPEDPAKLRNWHQSRMKAYDEFKKNYKGLSPSENPDAGWGAGLPLG
jgi:hypothetical protein